jgi:hypothetical protein
MSLLNGHRFIGMVFFVLSCFDSKTGASELSMGARGDELYRVKLNEQKKPKPFLQPWV